MGFLTELRLIRWACGPGLMSPAIPERQDNGGMMVQVFRTRSEKRTPSENDEIPMDTLVLTPGLRDRA